MGRCRVVLSIVWWSYPSPQPLLDSSFRWNDEISGGGLSRIGVRRMVSLQWRMPAGAGTPRYEKPELWLGTASWRGGFCHAPTRPQRGTSPSPREVFDRTTLAVGGQLPSCRLTCFRAGFVRGFPPARE